MFLETEVDCFQRVGCCGGSSGDAVFNTVSIQTAGVQITVRLVITVAQWEAHCGVADLLLSFCYYFGKKRIPL